MMKALALIAAFMLALPLAAFAADEYKDGDLMFVSLTNATDGTIVVGASCKLTVINNTIAAVINASMSDAFDGTFYWPLSGLNAQPWQPYRAKVVCTTAGGANWTDFTYFYVVDIDSPQRLFTLNATLNSSVLGLNANVSALPQTCGQGASNLTDAQVWNYAERNLTQNITQNLTAADVWDHATRTLTQNITGNFSEAGVAAAVWASASRTLTSFGTLVVDIATAVWNAVTRTLTAVSLTNSTQTEQLANASANITVTAGGTYYNTDNSTFNIILPAEG